MKQSDGEAIEIEDDRRPALELDPFDPSLAAARDLKAPLPPRRERERESDGRSSWLKNAVGGIGTNDFDAASAFYAKVHRTIAAEYGGVSSKTDAEVLTSLAAPAICVPLRSSSTASPDKKL